MDYSYKTSYYEQQDNNDRQRKVSISEKASKGQNRRESIQNRRQSVRTDTKSKNSNKVGEFLNLSHPRQS